MVLIPAGGIAEEDEDCLGPVDYQCFPFSRVDTAMGGWLCGFVEALLTLLDQDVVVCPSSNKWRIFSGGF